MADMFDAIASAKTTFKSDHLRDGKGTLLVKKILCEDKEAGPTFIVEFEVVDSASKGDVNPATREPVIPNAPGTSVSYVQQLSRFKSAAGNVKSFVLALLGYNESEVTAEAFKKVLKELIAADQPATGMVVGYSTYQSATQKGPNAGKVNTYPNFTHIKQTKDQISSRKAKLESAEAA